MLTKNKGNVWGNVQGTLFGHWTPGFGVYWKALVTMESKVLAHGLTGCRGDEKKHKERHQVRHLAPPMLPRIRVVWKKVENVKSGLSPARGDIFLYFEGPKSKRKVEKC